MFSRHRWWARRHSALLWTSSLTWMTYITLTYITFMHIFVSIFFVTIPNGIIKSNILLIKLIFMLFTELKTNMPLSVAMIFWNEIFNKTIFIFLLMHSNFDSQSEKASSTETSRSAIATNRFHFMCSFSTFSLWFSFHYVQRLYLVKVIFYN